MTTLPSGVQRPDIVLEDEGSVVLGRPLTLEAREWESAHVAPDVPRFAGAFAIQPASLEYVVAEMLADGLLVAAGGEL